MSNLFDRDYERKQIEGIFEPEQSNQPFVVWIEGIEGSGKTEFMRYIIDKTQLFLFEYSDFKKENKCEKINMQSEFSLVSNIIFTIMKKYTIQFQNFLQDYFDDQNRITILDAGCLILPQLKFFAPIKKLLENKYEIISSSQAKITDKLTNMQLSDFFSSMILYYLTDINAENKHTIFSIDDAQWIDLSSLKTLESLIGKLIRDHGEYKISFLITIRDKESLSFDESTTYTNVFRFFNQYYNVIHTVIMNNFDLSITRQLVASKKRCFLENNIRQIFQITKGNPQELVQTLRLPDKEIERILKQNENTPQLYEQNHYISKEMIICLYKENEYFAIILNILSVLSCPVSSNLIYDIAMEVNVSCKVIVPFEFRESIDELCRRDILKSSAGGYTISHDSMKFLIVKYIQSSGEYSQYVYAISDILISEKSNIHSKLNSNIYLALTLLEEVDPCKGFTTFLNLLNTSPELLDGEMFEIGARCFCLDYTNFDKNIIHNVIVYKVLPALFNAAKTKTVKHLSEYLYEFRHEFDNEIYITYLFFYIKALVEMSILKSTDVNSISAIYLFEELQQAEVCDADTLLQIYLLGMSIYEHLLDYQMIDDLYQKATGLVENNNQLSEISLAKFYRNKGLVFSHKTLIPDYRLALKYATQMPPGIQKCIIQGTSQNNLGLAYFYSGRIKRALVCFNNSIKSLESVGCDATRVYNNIAVCYYILKKYDSANNAISKAFSIPIDGYFINTSMKTNYALILDSMGNTNDAIRILNEIIQEYDSGNRLSSDEVPYSAAMLNRAYIHIKSEEYLDAVKLIKKSCEQIYRYEHDLQQNKRQELIKFCLFKEGLSTDSSYDLDSRMNTSDIYQMPYSLIPFAYYVI